MAPFRCRWRGAAGLHFWPTLQYDDIAVLRLGLQASKLRPALGTRRFKLDTPSPPPRNQVPGTKSPGRVQRFAEEVVFQRADTRALVSVPSNTLGGYM